MTKINNSVKVSQPVAAKKASTNKVSANKSQGSVKSGSALSKKAEKNVATKPTRKSTTSSKKATQSMSSGMKKKESTNSKKAAVKKTGGSGSSVGEASASAKLIQSLPAFLREAASSFLNENDIKELYNNYINGNIPEKSETSSTGNYVTSVPSTNMIYTSQGTRSDYTPPSKPLKSENSSKKSVVSTYVDKPDSRNSDNIVKVRTKEQDSRGEVVLDSVDRPENSYPTPKQEYDAAKKQQQYAKSRKTPVVTKPPKVNPPKKTTLKPVPAPPPTYIKESDLKPIIQFNKKQIKTLKSGTSFVLSLAPVAGDLKDVAEFILGKDLITGEKFTKGERIVSLLALCLPLVTGPEVKGAKKGGEKLFKELDKVDAEKLLKQLGDEDFLKISKELMKQLDEKDLKKVKQMMKDADEIADEVGEKKFKEVLEKAEGGGKIVGKGGKLSITVSKDRLRHSVLGEFSTNGRMINGGHGQENIEFLNKHNIEYNIVKVYDNGVRVGNIPSHKNKFKRTGIGQAWFPESWKEKDIKNAGEYVANLPENINIPDGTWVFGEYKGVRVGIIKNNGEIGTIIPDNSRQP